MNASTADSVREDRLLLAAVAGRDQLALRRLYDRHAGLLMHIAFDIVRSWESAEEVVQDVFVQCWSRAHTYEPSRGSPTAWLAAMTRNRAIDHHRYTNAASRGNGRSVPLDGVPDRLLPHDGHAGSRLETGDLAEALQELPQSTRTAILLAAYGGLTHMEIAQVLQAPPGTVKSWIRRGLGRLRGRLQTGSIGHE